MKKLNTTTRQSSLSALENMHYSQMIRFDNAEEARVRPYAFGKTFIFAEGDDDDDVVFMKSDSPNLNVSKSYENEKLVDDDDDDDVLWSHFVIQKVPKVVYCHLVYVNGNKNVSLLAEISGPLVYVNGRKRVSLLAEVWLHLVYVNGSKCLLPVIQHFKCRGKVVESLNMLNSLEEDYMCGKCWVDVSIDCWVVKRLMKLYVDYCNDLFQPPNLILLKKLYKLQVSEDEIDASDCGLEDVPAAPLLNALKLHMTIAALNISHNSLGIDSMEKLKQVFMSSSQKFGSLVLDLHCTGLSQTSLNEMCECTELLSRLEVLNISGNRLTDGSASQLSTILQNCKGLYSLNIEDCFLTSRTIQKLTNSLDPGSLLEELFIGYNSPISGNAMIDLFNKLATLKSFSKLSISGIELMYEDANDSLCKLVTTVRLSKLMIGRKIDTFDGFVEQSKSSGSQA
ncbi:protein TONSOKU [Tanacetum coccineum]